MSPERKGRQWKAKKVKAHKSHWCAYEQGHEQQWFTEWMEGGGINYSEMGKGPHKWPTSTCKDGQRH